MDTPLLEAWELDADQTRSAQHERPALPNRKRPPSKLPQTQVLTQLGTTGTPFIKGGTGMLANSGSTAVVREDLHSPV